MPAASKAILIDPLLKQLIPALSSEEFVQLEANILRDGCRDALVLWGDTLIDGHHRLDICQRHGLPYATTSLDFADRDAVLDWIDTNQLGRRNLGPDQIKLLRGRLYNRKKKRIGGRSDRTFGGDILSPPKTAEVLGAQFGVSDRTIKRDGKAAQFIEELAKTAPEEAQAVLDGKKRINEVRRTARLEQVKEAAALPSAKYRVIYADPPWKYGDQLTEDYGPTRFHYPAMTVAELCTLPVADLCEPDAVLFLWVTSPLLFECAPIIKAWGFQYKASFVWDKMKHNMGHYNSMRHEFLLICTRGSCTPDTPKLYDSVVSIERTDHSSKPEEFRTMIDALYPHGKRVELFARAEVKGWDAWGNQAETG